MRDEYDDDDGGVPKAAENFWISSISRPGPPSSLLHDGSVGLTPGCTPLLSRGC